MGATNPPWKKFERGCARDVGTERIPVTGERDGADFETAMFAFSAKCRQGQFPRTVAEWLDSVRTKAASRDPAKTGVLVIHRPRAPRGESLVVMSWSDFLELHGPVNAAGAREPSVP